MARKRNAHYLRTVKGGWFPRTVVCVAVVQGDDGEIGWTARCWQNDDNDLLGSFDWESKNAAAFWNAMRQFAADCPGSWVVFMGACHSLSVLGFWDRVEEDDWQLTGNDPCDQDDQGGDKKKPWQGFCVIADPPTCIQARPGNGKGNLLFLDARNYGVSSWHSLGIAQSEFASPVYESERRAIHLLRFITDWIATVKEANLGSLKQTAASQAMHAYRYRFLRSPVKVHDNVMALALERQALHAGRNECWRLGTVRGPVYHLDVNSFYPSVARNANMPARLAGYAVGKVPDAVELTKRGFLCIAEVTLETPDRFYPVRFNWDRHGASYRRAMGMRCKVRPLDGDVIYPIGCFHTALCGPELSFAFRNNAVRRVWSVSWYEPSDLFTSWADTLHAINEGMQRTGKTGQSECVKRVRNSLFGKFAQWSWNWTDCHTVFASQPFCTWDGPPPLTKEEWQQRKRDAEMGEEREPRPPERLVKYRAIGWKVQHERPDGEHHDSCPAISAWVYSLARVRLLELALVAGERNVHYMDSDSLWCNQTGFNNLRSHGVIDASKMGMLKIKGMYTNVAFHGLKQYTVDGVDVNAGLPSNAVKTWDGGWLFWTPETVKSALHNNRSPGSAMVPHNHRPRRQYRHGTRSVNGEVLPIQLQEEMP